MAKERMAPGDSDRAWDLNQGGTELEAYSLSKHRNWSKT